MNQSRHLFGRTLPPGRNHLRAPAHAQCREFGGLSHVMPGYAAVFLAMVMTAIGLPLLCVFISEFLSLRGAFEANPIWSAWARSESS